MITLHHDDCFNIFPKIADKSIDLVLCDMPYGTTACKWDTVIDLERMWKELKRIVKPNTAIVLFGSEPFSSALRVSNIKEFRYDWIWNKRLAGNGILAKHQPLKIHEIISVFYKHKYKPIMTTGKYRQKLSSTLKLSPLINIVDGTNQPMKTYNDQYYPKSILDFSLAGLRKGRLHPTQKPVALMEYLIKTYSNEGDTVLDFCMGSGTTGVACKNLNRSFIGVEKEENYFNIARERING